MKGKKKPTKLILLEEIYPGFERYARKERGYFCCASIYDLQVFMDYLEAEGFVIVRVARPKRIKASYQIE